jgi:taurine dioxygenase
VRVIELEPLGAVVEDITVGPLADDDVLALTDLLADRGVLILPGQDVDDPEFLAFLHSFGSLTFTKGETPVAGHPDLNVVSNVGRTTPPRSSFHVDTSYVRHPPAYTALRAVTLPGLGGETLFSDQFAAYETLPTELRSELAGRAITHVVTGVELEDGDEREAAHSVFRPHPVSGRIALYLTTPARCRGISGIPDERAQKMIELLYAHSTRPENVLTHTWSPGDVVIWDNGCVLHRADHAEVDGDRVLHRGMVAGYREPAGALAS